MTRRLAFALALLPALAVADPPDVQHQPSTCTIAGQPISLCASIATENELVKTRIFFRKAGEKFYNFAEMSFSGLSYCGTLPAPILGKVAKVEYYIQAVDNKYETNRTSTYQLEVKPDGGCDFPPIEKDQARRLAIKVYASDPQQGKNPPKGFEPANVTFVPASKK
jgi:hypothetical protein